MSEILNFFKRRLSQASAYFNRHLTYSLLLWVIFSVCIPLIPFVFIVMIAWLFQRDSFWTFVFWQGLYDKGQIFLLSVGIAAGALNILITSAPSEKLKMRRLVVISMNVMLIGCAMFLFVATTIADLVSIVLSVSDITATTIVIILATLGIGISCIKLADVSNPEDTGDGNSQINDIDT